MLRPTRRVTWRATTNTHFLRGGVSSLRSVAAGTAWWLRRLRGPRCGCFGDAGERANQVNVTVESVETDAETVEIRDSFPPEWEFLGEFSNGEEIDDGVVSFGTFDTADLPSGDGDSKTFTYFIESPGSPDDTNAYEVGPAEALLTVEGEDLSATFAPAENVVAVGVSL